MCVWVGGGGGKGGGGQESFFLKFIKFGVQVTHMNGMFNGTIFWSSSPGALGRGQKVKYH